MSDEPRATGADSAAVSPTRFVRYFVNAEPQESAEHKRSVRQILEDAGFKPAEDYVLIRDEGDHKYTDLDESVPLHQDERFTAVYSGPTPTS